MTAREMLLQAMEDEELKKSEVYSPLLREYAKRDTSQRMYDYRQSIERKSTREQIDVKIRRLTARSS